MGGRAEARRLGVRVLVSPPSELRVLTRGGMDITERVPELRPLRRQSFGFVLDGELVADAGRAHDFYAIQVRLRKRATPARARADVRRVRSAVARPQQPHRVAAGGP
jgi:ATP-dependent DNA ligase